jgi:hypothetical protein
MPRLAGRRRDPRRRGDGDGVEQRGTEERHQGSHRA